MKSINSLGLSDPKYSTKPTSSHFHVDVMDGLRGIAIIIVVLFHVWQLSWLNHTISIGNFKLDLNFIPVTGFLGVELFFFISAFCLFYPYAKYLFEGGSFQTVKKFTYKRAIKILPSYYLSIIIITVFFTPGFFSSTDSLKQLLYHMLFIHNLFPETYGTINGVFWSLGVEVQFYILFPILCYLFRKWPVFVFIAMTGASILYRYLIQHYYFNKLDFLINQLPGFLDIFACGMLTAYLIVYLRSHMKSLKQMLPFFTLIAITCSVIFIIMLQWINEIRFVQDGIKLWQNENRTYLALVFLFLAVTSSLSMNFWKKVLANKFFIFMSVISYNLYIWHQFIAAKLFNARIPSPSTADPHGDFNWQILFSVLAILIGILFSSLITYLYERPILKLGFINYFKKIFMLIKPKNVINK